MEAVGSRARRVRPRPPLRLQLVQGPTRRLEGLRLSWAAPLPGIVLAILDQELMTVTDVLLTEDGHAQERSLLDE